MKSGTEAPAPSLLIQVNALHRQGNELGNTLSHGREEHMRYVTGLLLVGLTIGPALAETTKDSTTPNKKTSPDAVTYEDCVARCEKCRSRRNPDCVKNFCTGYPH